MKINVWEIGHAKLTTIDNASVYMVSTCAFFVALSFWFTIGSLHEGWGRKCGPGGALCAYCQIDQAQDWLSTEELAKTPPHNGTPWLVILAGLSSIAPFKNLSENHYGQKARHNLLVALLQRLAWPDEVDVCKQPGPMCETTTPETHNM